MKVLVTGSSGLIGSAVCEYFLSTNHQVVGLDNNMRQVFFGTEGSTENQQLSSANKTNFSHQSVDIRDLKAIQTVFEEHNFDAVIHCAAQPSHDKAKDIPILDFEVNAQGTLYLLEAVRQFCPEAPFVFTSTNKVYGDAPNFVPLKELKTRYSYSSDRYKFGIDESLSVDHTTHSLFGAGKLAADIYVQEYGRYFGLKTMLLRLGCVTGKSHASVKLHGFLSYFVKSLIREGKYEIIGYKGKQVRDQIHASDVARAISLMVDHPRSGAVYNLGGGLKNNASILELVTMVEKKLHKKFEISYTDQARIGDHICYISDTRKFEHDYPSWQPKMSLDQIIDELIDHATATHTHS